MEKRNREEFLDSPSKKIKLQKKTRNEYLEQTLIHFYGKQNLFPYKSFHSTLILCQNYYQEHGIDLIFQMIEATCHFHLGNFRKCQNIMQEISNSETTSYDDEFALKVAKLFLMEEFHFNSRFTNFTHWKFTSELFPIANMFLQFSSIHVHWRDEINNLSMHLLFLFIGDFKKYPFFDNYEPTLTENQREWFEHFKSFENADKSVLEDCEYNEDEEYVDEESSESDENFSSDSDEEGNEMIVLNDFCFLKDSNTGVLVDIMLKKIEQDNFNIHLLSEHQFQIIPFDLEQLKLFIDIYPPIFCKMLEISERDELIKYALKNYGSMYFHLSMLDRENVDYFIIAYKQNKNIIKQMDASKYQSFVDDIGRFKLFNCIKKLENLNFKFK
jgi:hypothetical protein